MSKKKLFISWSGDKSKFIAEELKKFFEESPLQEVTPFFSPDITKGTGWLEKINEAINNSSAGILCLTQENHMKPWVLFESGALSRVGIVCPIVFDMKKDEIKSPLNIFQASEFNKKEFKKLFEDIRKSCQPELDQKVIDRIFEENGRFDSLEKSINEILIKYPSDKIWRDETLMLLNEISAKVNLLASDKDNAILDIQYIELLVHGFYEHFQSLETKIKVLNKSLIQNIVIGIDYIVTQTNVQNPKLIKEIEELNIQIDTL